MLKKLKKKLQVLSEKNAEIRGVEIWKNNSLHLENIQYLLGSPIGGFSSLEAGES